MSDVEATGKKEYLNHERYTLILKHELVSDGKGYLLEEPIAITQVLCPDVGFGPTPTIVRDMLFNMCRHMVRKVTGDE